MALMKCPDCKKRISDKAESCPHCGYPTPGNDKSWFEKDINEIFGKRGNQNTKSSITQLKWAVFLGLVSLLIVYASVFDDESSKGNEFKEMESRSQSVSTKDAEGQMKITISTFDNRARLLPRPEAGQGEEIMRIPTGTSLVVQGSREINKGMSSITYYYVYYNNDSGWVSEYDTK